MKSIRIIEQGFVYGVVISEMLMHGFEALISNVDGGYLEAIVQGYKLGLLTCADYNNLFLV